MPEAYYQDGSVTIYHGEALKVLSSLDDNRVGAVVTDPPYSSGGSFRGIVPVESHLKNMGD